MLDVALLAAFASMFGVAVRAFLEKKDLKFYLYYCFSIGIAAGIFSFFYYFSLFNLPLTFGKYFGIFLFFFMVGYVLSDFIESLIFIFAPSRKRGKR